MQLHGFGCPCTCMRIYIWKNAWYRLNDLCNSLDPLLQPEEKHKLWLQHLIWEIVGGRIINEEDTVRIINGNSIECLCMQLYIPACSSTGLDPAGWANRGMQQSIVKLTSFQNNTSGPEWMVTPECMTATIAIHTIYRLHGSHATTEY